MLSITAKISTSQLMGLSRVVGILFDCPSQFFHGRRRLFQRTGLLLGARRKVVIA